MRWSLVLAGIFFAVFPLLSDDQPQSQSYIADVGPIHEVHEAKAWPKQLSVLSYNTFGMWIGPIHVGNIARSSSTHCSALRQTNADVVLLQELWRVKDRRYVRMPQMQYPPYRQQWLACHFSPVPLDSKISLGG